NMATKQTKSKRKTRRVDPALMNGAKRRHAERKIEDAVNFEVLEKRQLMSVVNVTDFGAKVNDGADDRAAVQAAVDASKVGDVVQFPAGTLNFAGTVTLRSGRVYQGVRGTTPMGIENLPRFVIAQSKIEGGFRLD